MTPEYTISHLLSAGTDANPALLSSDRPIITFASLRRSVSTMGERLGALGIGGDDRVALVMPNGVEMATALLAVTAHAGCAPLNPGFSLAEFSFYLQDLRPRALLVLKDSDSPARAAADALSIPVIELALDADGPVLSGTLPKPADKSAPAAAGADSVALVLHTSGTTARPKLVPLTQRNLAVSARNIVQTLRLTEHDRCLNVLPLFHIHGFVAGLLAPLAAGGSVICTPGFSEARFFEWMTVGEPTWYTAVPTMHQAVLNAAQAITQLPPKPLRLIRSSSAALPPQVLGELERVFQCPVIEAYGMTEAAHQMACNPLPPAPRKPGSVGVPAGPEIAIMGEAGPSTDAFVRGEILIRGANVTLGYADNPTANQGAYVDGWFRTGDEGYFDADGYLFISGRLKEMINRGGEKVSPREIDEALLDHPEVAQAVAFAVPHPTLGEDVAAAVVVRPGAALSAADARAFLFERLAGFKVPSRIVLVDSIPKGATGKIQRLRLAELLADSLRTDFVAPANAVEDFVTRAFAEVLKLDAVGSADNFFALGGDSLRATQIMARVQAAFDAEFPIVTLFRHPTAAELADALCAAIGTEATALAAAASGGSGQPRAAGDAPSPSAIPRLPRRGQL